jgi:hypothetical protein
MAPPGDSSHCWGSGVSDFRVELQKRVFVPGEIVRGTVHLTTARPVECRGLHVRLEHKCEVHWTVVKHYNNPDRDVQHDFHGEQARHAAVV